MDISQALPEITNEELQLILVFVAANSCEIAKNEKVSSTVEKLPPGKKSYTPKELCQMFAFEEICEMYTPDELSQMFTPEELCWMFTAQELLYVQTGWASLDVNRGSALSVDFSHGSRSS
ncbi:hypothetical protein OROMI_028829 [Orobanche minor]